jgi:CelD/BcsL family acetyltransferase involved in cellulose biosynthesis
LGTLGLWRHRYCFLTTPLVHRERAAAAIRTFCTWYAEGAFADRLLQLEWIPANGPFVDSLHRALAEAGLLSSRRASYARATISVAAGPDASLTPGLSAKRRREYLRQERRLRERGAVEYRLLAPTDDHESFTQTFLRLEASGWKGRRGSALMLTPDGRHFFEEMTAGAHGRGQLLFSSLLFDGRQIAMKCDLRSGKTGFTFKTAYDESMAEYSPGVLLELANLRRLQVARDLDWIDSCSMPRSMLSTLWTERRTIQTLLVTTDRLPGKLALGAASALGTVRRATGRAD